MYDAGRSDYNMILMQMLVVTMFLHMTNLSLFLNQETHYLSYIFHHFTQL